MKLSPDLWRKMRNGAGGIPVLLDPAEWKAIITALERCDDP